MNAINHKRYESNIPIQISVYNDRIYIWNDGVFPKEINKEQIYEKHISKPYNPLIAQTFFKAGFIESWGRGFEKIENECNEFNCPVPDIKINEGGVMIECNPSENYLKILEEFDRSNENVGVNVGVNVTQNRIFELIKSKDKITQIELAELLKLSQRTIERNIAVLKEKGYIERIGSDKKGYWKVLNYDKK